MGNLVSQDYSLESLLQQGTSNLFLSPTRSPTSLRSHLENDSDIEAHNSRFEYNEAIIRDTSILHVMEFCEVETLVQFSKTCRLIYEVQEMYKSQIWKLNFIRHSMASNSFKVELLQEQQHQQQQKEEQKLHLQNTSLDEFFLASPTANAHGGFFDLENWKEKCLNYISVKRKLVGSLESSILQRLNEQDANRPPNSSALSTTVQINNTSSSQYNTSQSNQQASSARSNSVSSNISSSSPPQSNSPIVSSPKGSFTLNASHTRTYSKLYAANSTLLSSPRNANKPSITTIFSNTGKNSSTSPTLQPSQTPPQKSSQLSNTIQSQIDSTPLHVDIKAESDGEDEDSWNLSEKTTKSKKLDTPQVKKIEETSKSDSKTPTKTITPKPVAKNTKDTDSWGLSDEEDEKDINKKTPAPKTLQSNPATTSKIPLSIPLKTTVNEDKELDDDDDDKTDSWADIEEDDTVVGVDVDQTGVLAPKMTLDVAPSLPTIKSHTNTSSLTKKKTDTDDDDWGLSEEEKSPKVKPKVTLDDKKPAKKEEKEDDSWELSDTEEEAKKSSSVKKPSIVPPIKSTTTITNTNLNTNSKTTVNTTSATTMTATPTPIPTSTTAKSKVSLHHLINILCDEDLIKKHYFSIDKATTVSFYQEILDLSQQLFSSNSKIEKLPQLKEEDLQLPLLKDGLFYQEVFGHGIQIKWILIEAVLPTESEKLNPLYPCLPVLNRLTTPLAPNASKNVLVRPALMIGPFLLSWSHYCNNSLIIPQKLIGNALRATYSVHRIAEVYHPSFDQVCALLCEQIVLWNTCYRFDLHQKNAHTFLEHVLDKLNLSTCLYRISSLNSIWTEWLHIMKSHGQNGLVVEVKEDDSFYGPFLIKYKYNTNTTKMVPSIPLGKSNGTPTSSLKNVTIQNSSSPSTPVTSFPPKMIRIAFPSHVEVDKFLNQLMEYDTDFSVHHHQDYNLLLLMDRLFWLNYLDNKNHTPFQPLLQANSSNAKNHSTTLLQGKERNKSKLFSILLEKKDICPFGSMDMY